MEKNELQELDEKRAKLSKQLNKAVKDGDKLNIVDLSARITGLDERINKIIRNPIIDKPGGGHFHLDINHN